MRFFLISASLIGMGIGFAFPGISNAALGITISMLGPSGSSGQSITLNCGWHTQACDQVGETGDALDWDNTSTYTVYFRARGYQPSGGGPHYVLASPVTQPSGGPWFCDIVKVQGKDSWAPFIWRFDMLYYHVEKSSYVNYANVIAQAAWPGYYNNIAIATMIDDSGCDTTGRHVHEIEGGLASGTSFGKGSGFPNGNYCLNDGDPSDCESYVNNSTVTRWFSY